MMCHDKYRKRRVMKGVDKKLSRLVVYYSNILHGHSRRSLFVDLELVVKERSFRINIAPKRRSDNTEVWKIMKGIVEEIDIIMFLTKMADLVQDRSHRKGMKPPEILSLFRTLIEFMVSCD
jgi:hypothetical protein